MEPPTIQTKRLEIRALTVDDAELFYAYRSLPEVYRFQQWMPESAAEVVQFLTKMHLHGFDAADTWFQLGLFLKSHDELIGDMGLHFLAPDNEQVEISFTISPAHQRRGYAQEAATAVMVHLFQRMNKHRIIALVDPNNNDSISLLEKLGLRKEGHFRKSIRIRGVWEDDLLYAVLREEWQP
ncbi:MAG TPA: GNAT family N-acetyltransferase [Anaerolineae bacterium]|nr:GNAT family N-acetyltransferase [Anaerolineae bacterium]